MTTPAAAAPEPQKKKKIPFSVKFSIFILLVTAALFLPATIVFCVCMVPTLVAVVIDSQPQKTMWITIGTLNLAGTVPAWFTLWQMGPRIENAFMLSMNPLTLMVAYGAAGLGWVVYQNVTPLVAGSMVKKNRDRVRDIDERHKELMRKWGEDVAKQG